MHPWLAFTSLILLWTDAVVSQVQVSGVVGQPVTLPCTYSTASEVTTMCWGRGGCPRSVCSDQLIWTDGYRVTFQKNMRYELNGIIPKGNVSLTIKNAQQSDSGTYCCRIEHSGWFNDKKVNILLEIKPAPPKTTSVPTSPRVSTSAPTTPATTLNLTTAPSEVTNVPISPNISTSTPTTSATTLNLTTENISSSPVQTTETQPTTPQKTYTTSLQSNSCLTDGNGTVAQPSDGGWQYNETLVCLEQTPQLTTNEAFYAGISITAMILLTILAAVISKKYLCTRKKVLQISKVSSNDLKNGALENATVVHYRADENIYFENNVYDTH
ncbi:hepatitis A virus cellular receptor 1 isoform X1 [Pteropus alecto]|uniref:hepatitis A virus cellular receptor 1 isoform X1 n=1 Tax=Pteropus alecto TaxID=9402 RepID=UPI0007687FAC|nr:hepatitis A virus cellular receptor 1 isoform X1 [Pteropus alecto]XP_015440802.1 hepatitis A virus cellular receptor 1 isoform X1 [Pteropus alecto]XP_024898830.1 hepatitis A virus cellular receptor 1 isoform X1 [Pteropus alecto]XP_024898831.1 hepatitis A virus cellular receptor 1 isoform X1 [Pteropus alecto]